ncbi:MAG: PAS domain S-box protein [Myxococcales bacterium]|nr:PAS domain S-box protein [Myxococcales bacterium]
MTYGLTVLYLALLRVQHLVKILAQSQIFLDGLLVTILVVMTQGSESPFVFGYVLVVLAASITLYRSGALLAARSPSSCSVVSCSRSSSVLLVHCRSSPRRGWVKCCSRTLDRAAGSSPSLSSRAPSPRSCARPDESSRRKSRTSSSSASSTRRSCGPSPAGVLSVDDIGCIRFGNDAAMQILKISESELVGSRLEDVVPAMAPAWSRFRDARFREPAVSRFETDYARRGGDTIRIGFSVAPLAFLSELSALIVFQDVTDIVRLKDAVARSERLASVGQFAAGLAHEVRNPLASMCASIDVLRAALAPPEHLTRLMDNITREAERLNGLITDFLALARPREIALQRTDLALMVDEVLNLFENDGAGADLRLVRDLSPGVHAEVDPDLMKQVVWNLIRNSAEAMRGRPGTLVVEVHGGDGGPTIRVEDDGPGVDPALLQKIFDPFYTTKDRGSGLGLAITNSIVEAHGATMLFESEVGVGTAVTIRFGLSQVPVRRSSPPTAVEAIARSTGSLPPTGGEAPWAAF